MSLALHAAVLRLPWQRARRGSPWITLAILLTLPLAVAGIAWVARMPTDLATVLVLLGLLTTLWYVQVDGWLNQNLPVLARHLPRQLSTLRLQLILGGLGLAVVAAALLAAVSPRPWPQWLPVIALVLLAMAWLARLPWLWMASWIPFLHLGAMQRLLQPWMESSAASWALVLLALGLAPLMGEGGRLHRSTATSGQLSRGTLAPGEGTAASPRLGRVFCWPQHAWREALVRRASPANALARLDVILMGNTHWAVMLWQMLAIGLIFLGFLGLLNTWIARHQSWLTLLGDSAMVTYGLVMGAVATATHSVKRLLATRREQALLVLLPGLPGRPQLGQALRHHWLRQTTIGLFIAALLLTLAISIARPMVAGMLTGCLAVLSLTPLLLLQDWSRLPREATSKAAFLTAGLTLGLGGIGMGSPESAWLLPALTTPLALGLLLWRWRVAARWPAQLPVGRR